MLPSLLKFVSGNLGIVTPKLREVLRIWQCRPIKMFFPRVFFILCMSQAFFSQLALKQKWIIVWRTFYHQGLVNFFLRNETDFHPCVSDLTKLFELRGWYYYLGVITGLPTDRSQDHQNIYFTHKLVCISDLISSRATEKVYGLFA